MERTCALVLLIVGSVIATPHGYGTKGGAAAKADASAVARAYAGIGNVPINIPSGEGYSGSFSKASSSSFSSSSASSSSSAFSYSGSGALTFPGNTNGGNNCGSSGCSGSAGLIGEQGSTAAGSQTYSGANAASLAGGYASQNGLNGESQTNKAQDCGPEGCQGSKDSGPQIGSSGVTDVQQSSDAKAAASNGAARPAGSLTFAKDKSPPQSGNDCRNSDCSNLPGADSNAASSSQYGSNKKCSSGQCEGSSIDYGSNDIRVPISGGYNSKSNYNTNDQIPQNDKTLITGSDSDCSNGNCGPSSNSKPYAQSPSESPNCNSPFCNNYGQGPSSAAGYDKPSSHLTAPKLESACTTPNCKNADYPYENSATYSPGKSFSQATMHTYSPEKPTGPACAPGTPGCGSPGPACLPGTPGCSSPGSACNPGTPGCSSPGQACLPGTPGCDSAGQTCAPGTPGCGSVLSINGPVDCVSGNCGSYPAAVPDYSESSSKKPSYFHETSLSHFSGKPSGLACTPGTPGCSSSGQACLPGTPGCGGPRPACLPGTPGCNSVSSINGPVDCVSGNCGSYSAAVPSYSESSNNKPSYSHEISPSHFSGKPLGPACAPGTPGCGNVPTINGPVDCVSGNCGLHPVAVPHYSGSSNNKPSYTHGTSPSHFSGKPSGPACAPGIPGCGSPGQACLPGAPGCGGLRPACLPGTPGCGNPGPACTPGTPGCDSVSSINGPVDCVSGNCGAYPAAVPNYSGSLNNKPNYSHGTSPSHFSGKPSGPACAPGTPGCSSSGLACAPGTPGCGSVPLINGPVPSYNGSPYFKPSYSHESSPSHLPVNPSGTTCAPGSPGCGGVSPVLPTGYGGFSSNKPTYTHGVSPSYSLLKPSQPDCAPGTPGCSIVPSSPGYDGPAVIKPSYTQTSYSPLKPIGLTCIPGSPGCGDVSSPSGPSNCELANCVSSPASSGYSGSKPIYSHGTSPSGPACAPGSPGCNLAPSILANSGSTLSTNRPSYTAPSESFPSAPSAGSSLSASITSYGASGAGSSVNQGYYGIHGAGSVHTSGNTPSSGFPPGPSGSGTYGSAPGHPSASSVSGASLPNQGFPGALSSAGCKTPNCAPGLGNVGATAGADVQGTVKEKLPAYSGGFGGPAGILKPNEFSAATSSTYQNKPALSSGSLITINKPACASGNCDTSPHSTSNTPSGSASGVQASAAASANAVAYTGGFGGPPGFLKPYDNGKVDLKGIQLKDSAPELHQGISGSGAQSPYSSLGGSQLGGGAQASAVAQANAGAFGTTGSFDNKKLHRDNNEGHGHNGGVNSCGGGCGESGLAGAKSVATSVASATSGAGAYGSAGSYASSSAHATAGASVKGGYGKR